MGSNETTKAVILARGLGMRMRRPDDTARLDAEQERAADAGLKAMIPAGARPFLDYVLSGLADAGFRDICMVIGPEHVELREYYEQMRTDRLRFHFAIQQRPIGTADAMLVTQEFVGPDAFLVLNSDNYYPIEMYRQLRELGEPGVAGFERAALIRESNVPAERVLRYSILEIDEAGYLKRILEKPDAATLATHGDHAFIGMNCWLFRPSIYRACREVKPSTRGELELPEAVDLAVTQFGERIRVLKFYAGVLDLSYRADVASVSRKLCGLPIHL